MPVKFLKWAGIVAAALIGLLLIGLLSLPIFFPLDKIKDFAAAKLSESLRREVKIEKAAFDLFSGIKLEKISVEKLISADALELRYAFWPLFSRQVVIKEIRLVKPEILIEKNPRGEFNFSDLLKKDHGRKPKAATGGVAEKRPPFDLFISSFSVQSGKITYTDRSAGTQSEIRDFNFRIAGFALALVKPIDLSASANLIYQGKTIPLSLAGKIGVNLADEKITVPSLSLSIAGETLSASGALSGWKASPHLDIALSSSRFNLDPLAAAFAAPSKVKKPKAKPGELTKTVHRSVASVPGKLSAAGSINAENLTLFKFKADKIKLKLSLANKLLKINLEEVKIYGGALAGRLAVDLRPAGLAYKVEGLKLSGFNAAPFSNDLVETFLTKLPDHRDLLGKVHGNLDLSASLAGRGVEPQDILSNVAGEASLSLKNGELKRLKTLAAVGKTIKSSSLQEDIQFGLLTASLGLKSQVVDVKALKLDKPDFKLHFKGGVDLGRLLWVPGNRLTLKLAPALTKDLPPEVTLLRDPQGWLELTFEMTGGLKLPLPRPILEKPFEAAVGKLKLKVDAKKVEIEQKAGQALEEEKSRLQEEAKGKLKQLFKF